MAVNSVPAGLRRQTSGFEESSVSMVTSLLRDARRIVVKVGSSLVTNEGRGLDEQAIGEWLFAIGY